MLHFLLLTESQRTERKIYCVYYFFYCLWVPSVFFLFLRGVSGASVIIAFRAGVAVTEPARRGLHVGVGGAPETFQEGIRTLRLFSQALLSPFSQSHHHTDNPEGKWTNKKHINIWNLHGF